jgi:TolA-binding protein
MGDVQDFYRRTGVNSYKAQRVANVLQRLDPVHMYMYVLQAEIPPADVKPIEVIPQADKMFAQGVDLYEKGKGILHTFITTDYNKERQALLILLDLIHRYPRSTKVAQAAFYIGEIYKEYFNEDVRACQWYERAWQWDKGLTLPARFQAAVVNDLRLYNRAKAIELYRQVIQHEQFDASNVAFSHRRIRELTGS